MKMNMNSRQKVSLVLLFIGLLISIATFTVSVMTDHWWIFKNDKLKMNMGLWQACNGVRDLCVKNSLKDTEQHGEIPKLSFILLEDFEKIFYLLSQKIFSISIFQSYSTY